MPTDPSLPKRSLPPWLARALTSRHLWLWLFIACFIKVSLAVGENYPFSHFPMYGNPNSKPVDYLFVTDGDGKPLPVVWHTGDTAPSIKKRLNTLMKKYTAAHKLKKEADVPDAERKRMLGEVLGEFVAQADRRNRPMPDHLKLWLGLIHQKPEGYREEFICELDWHRPAGTPVAGEPGGAVSGDAVPGNSAGSGVNPHSPQEQ